MLCIDHSRLFAANLSTDTSISGADAEGLWYGNGFLPDHYLRFFANDVDGVICPSCLKEAIFASFPPGFFAVVWTAFDIVVSSF